MGTVRKGAVRMGTVREGTVRMARTPKEVPDAELAVLEVLWRVGESTVRELAGHLYPQPGSSAIATVQKLCERLLQKRFVQRDRTVRPATFAAAIERRDLIGSHLQGVADKLCSGSVAPLLTHLVESADLDAEAIRQLREQVARLDEDRKGGDR